MPMDEFESLSHTKWDCKYHVVFIPKCRRKTLYEELRRHLGEVFRRLAEQKESRIEEGHLMVDHVHMMIAIPPKYAVSQVIGYIKGKSAIHLARVYGEKKRSFVLGQRVLRLDSRSRRSGDTRVHPESGARGPPIGSNEPVALTGHRKVADKNRGRVSDPA
jgi:putative transposase